VGKHMDWKLFLAYITGSVDQDLLLRNEYVVSENRILRQQIRGRIRLNNGERKTLAEIGTKLGRQALAEVATIVKPETALPGTARWWRRSSTALGSARRQGAPLSMPNWRRW
jgi:putative transposase